MGFGLKYLQASAAESAKAGVAEVNKLEEASASDEAPVSQPAPMAPPAQQSPAAPPVRPNAFSGRPAFGSQAQAPAAAPARPSFTPPARTTAPATPSAPARPSFGVSAPTAAAVKEQPSRPSFGGSATPTPPAAGMPNARAVFVKTQAKFGGSQGAGNAPASDADSLSPQALFEIVCTHRNMSRSAIEAAKAQAQERPDAVLAQMRRIYDQEIAPSRVKHASDLPKAMEENPDKIVFLLRKDDKERIRIMAQEDASASGEVVLHGTTVENIHSASSPFLAPAELFVAVEPDVAPAPAVVAEPSPRSPKP